MAFRLPFVGRLHSLRVTDQDCAFRLRVSSTVIGDRDLEFHSRRPEVIAAAAAIEDGQLVGAIAISSSPTKHRTGFIVERLELLGRAVREAAA